MKTLLKSLLALVAIMAANSAIAQQTGNVSKANEFVQEVYLDCQQYQNEDQIEYAIDCLERTVFHVMPQNSSNVYPLLSEQTRKNKCNYMMSFDLTDFQPETFNPLKYFLKFHSETSSFYRVDGTDYVIEILPENK
jgi:hypothetical protein